LDNKKVIDIYTDGSCNPKFKLGGWAAFIFIQGKKTVLNGKEFNTTHNRMELQAAIKSIEFVRNQSEKFDMINIYTDSQYLVRLKERKMRLKDSDFMTKKDIMIQNQDLVKKIISFLDAMDIVFIKVTAHQKKTTEQNFNRDVDRLSRNIVRQYIKEKIIDNSK
jgi:ribonuclease HI